MNFSALISPRLFLRPFLCLCLFLFISNRYSVLLWRVFHHFVQTVMLRGWTAGRSSKGERPALYKEKEIFILRYVLHKKLFKPPVCLQTAEWGWKMETRRARWPAMPLTLGGSASSCADNQMMRMMMLLLYPNLHAPSVLFKICLTGERSPS